MTFAITTADRCHQALEHCGTTDPNYLRALAILAIPAVVILIVSLGTTLGDHIKGRLGPEQPEEYLPCPLCGEDTYHHTYPDGERQCSNVHISPMRSTQRL